MDEQVHDGKWQSGERIGASPAPWLSLPNVAPTVHRFLA